jgi:hypothetical protein
MSGKTYWSVKPDLTLFWEFLYIFEFSRINEAVQDTLNFCFRSGTIFKNQKQFSRLNILSKNANRMTRPLYKKELFHGFSTFSFKFLIIYLLQFSLNRQQNFLAKIKKHAFVANNFFNSSKKVRFFKTFKNLFFIIEWWFAFSKISKMLGS